MPKVKRAALESCVGNPRKKCGRPADPGIKGMDDKWRCLPCHKVHVELVYLESGDSQPNASEADNFVAALTEDEIERRRDMVRRYGTPGGSTMVNPYSRGGAPRSPIDEERELDAVSSRLAAATNRRESILAKYGRPTR
jgi:hypothetical protein